MNSSIKDRKTQSVYQSILFVEQNFFFCHGWRLIGDFTLTINVGVIWLCSKYYVCVPSPNIPRELPVHLYYNPPGIRNILYLRILDTYSTFYDTWVLHNQLIYRQILVFISVQSEMVVASIYWLEGLGFEYCRDFCYRE